MAQEVLDKLLKELFAEEISRTILDNGLTVLAKEDKSAEVVSVQVWVKTGSIHEGQYLGAGISHYLEHMLFKGTEKRNYKEISDDLQKVGANINAYTTFDRTVYYVDGPIESLETSMDVLSDITFNSLIDEQETIREQSVILREIDMGLDDPDRQFSQALFKTAFKEHPYRLPVIGERSLFEQITPTDLKSYYKARYVPNNMVLVVVGSCGTDKLIELAKKYFGQTKPQAIAPVFIPQENKQLARRAFYKEGNYEIVRGGISFRVPTLSHEDTPGLSILANLLGQGESSHLWQTLREEQNLVHDISASIWSPGSSGLFMISYTCDRGKREEVEQAIAKEIEGFYKEGISEERVKKTVTQAIVNEVNSRKTMGGQAGKLGTAEVVIGDLNYPPVFIEYLKQVTPEQVKILIKKYLIAQTSTQVALEPIGKQAEKSEKKKKEGIPDFEEIRLKNGVRIVLQSFSNVPKTHIRIGLLGGPLYEAPEIRGATGVLATLFTKDTKKRSALEVAQAIENIGGSFSEFVGNNTFGLGIEVLPTDIKLASDLLKEALLEPTFKKKQFETEKEAQIAAIREELDDITDHGIKYLREIFFGDYPYRDDPLGRIETLEKLSLEKLKDHYKTLLTPSNIVVGVSGEFDRANLLADLSKWLETIPEGKSVIPITQVDFKNPPKPGSYEKVLDKEQVVVFEAYRGVGVTDPDFEVGELLDELFSGMSSRLFVKVREEQGMAYFIGSSKMTGIHTGMFYFYGGTSTENYPKVFKEIETEVERIKRGEISDEEFERCKTCLKSGQRLSLQTPGSRAGQALLDTIYGLPVNHWRSYNERIDSIKKEQLQKFAIEHFEESKRVRLAIGKIA